MATADNDRPRSRDDAGDLTDLLNAWRRGEPGAEEELMRRIYPHLRQIARREMARQHGAPLSVTDLVHRTYVNLTEREPAADWESRAHFFNFAAKSMRRVLVDLARRRNAQKRRVEREDEVAIRIHGDSAAGLGHPAILDLDTALEQLREIDELAVRIIELRYFGGLTVEETASTLDVGRTTVVRKWRFARAWLRDRLEPEK